MTFAMPGGDSIAPHCADSEGDASLVDVRRAWGEAGPMSASLVDFHSLNRYTVIR